jgi:hypothetical protein
MRLSTGNQWARGSLLVASLSAASCNFVFGVDSGQPGASTGSSATGGTGAGGTGAGGTGAGGTGASGGTAGTGGATGGTAGTGGTSGSSGSGGSACASPDGQSSKWVAHPVGNYVDEAMAVARAPGGDIVVAGYYKSDDFVVKSLPALDRSGPDAQEDVYVAAYAPDTGSAKWAKGFTGPGTQRPTVAVTDPSGSPIVGGWFQQSFVVGGKTLTSDQQYSGDAAEGFVMKLDPAGGAPLWAKQFGGSSTDMVLGVAADSKGNVLVAGISAVVADLGTPPEPVPVDYGCGQRKLSKDASWVFLTKLDPNGNCVWDKQYVMDTRFSGIYSRTGLAVTVDPADNIILTGGFDGLADFGFTQLADAGGKDVFLLKLDPSGNGLWAQVYGDSNYQMASAVTTDPSGDIWLGGWYNGSVTLGDLPKQVDQTADNQNRKAFIAKLTVDSTKPTEPAKPVFLHALYDLADLTITSVVTTPDGDAVFGGVTQPAKGTTGIQFDDKTKLVSEINVDGNYYPDGFVAKYCKDGSLRWARAVATPSREFVWGVAADGAGHTFAAGSFDGVYDFGCLKSIMPYGVDPFVLGIGP